MTVTFILNSASILLYVQKVMIDKQEGERMGNFKQSKDFIEKICIENWKELYRFIYYKVQNREEAEDITQETFVKALSYLKNHDIKIREYGNYLKSISMNIIRDRWRSKVRRGSSINLDEVNPDEIAVDDFTDSIAEQARIEEAMGQLTKDQQEVINLRIIKGYSVADTAKILRKEEGAVKVLQHRALKALNSILDEKES